MGNSKIPYRLKGHGSFALREGWLYKGMKAVNSDPLIFRRKLKKDECDIINNKPVADVLGVGNNMATSIRFWLKACNLMKESTANGAELTSLGRLILEYDPYLDDMFTLWILHSNLVMNSKDATVWYLFFNLCDAESYSRDEIFVQLKNELERYILDNNYSVKSLEDDIQVLTNMYKKEKILNPEETLFSPLTRLRLLREEGHLYTRLQPDLSTLDERVILYILLKQMANETSISIDKVVEDINSVGRILNIGRVVINEYLDRLKNHGYIEVKRTAGLDVIYKITASTPTEIVNDYYNTEMN